MLMLMRPYLHDLVFQQIDAEEGYYNGRIAVKLFGVTDVSHFLQISVTHVDIDIILIY